MITILVFTFRHAYSMKEGGEVKERSKKVS